MTRRSNQNLSGNRVMPAHPLLIAAASAILAIVLYANTLPGPFLGDSVAEIRDNDRVHALSNIPSLLISDFWAAGYGRSPLYRPLTAVTTTALFTAGGGRPAVFHVWNLALHASSCALVSLLALALGLGGPVALIAGALFASHPVHTEAVGWISGQSDLLATTCLLAAWLAHIGRRRALAGGCFFLALLSKETAVIFPGLVLLGELMRPGIVQDGARRKVSWDSLGFYTGLLALYLGVRYAVLGHLFGGGTLGTGDPLNPLIGAPAATRILTSLKVVGVALRQSLFPRVLCVNYGYNQLPVVAGLSVRSIVAAAAVLSGVGLAAWAALRWLDRRRVSTLALGGTVFLVAFLPTSNLFFPAIQIFGERYLYLPVLGICLAAAVLLDAPRRRWGLAAALIVLSGARTVARNREFLDPIDYYEAGARACPDSAGAHYWLGITLREAGQLDRSIGEHRRALAIAPHYADAHAELGLSLMLSGQMESAESELTEALRGKPSDWQVRSNLADLHMRTGRLEQALSEYAALARELPDNPDVVANYAATLIDAGRAAQAREIFERLDREHPARAAGPNGLGALAAAEGRWDQAASLFGEAARREPRNTNALYNQARALARTGRVEEAVRVLKRASDAGVIDPGIEQLLGELGEPQHGR
jgi:tetratricopeptide (TPR) repeat protein